MDIVFLGTGTSEGIPRISCLMNTKERCKTCFDALKPSSPNRRRNTSIMIRITDSKNTTRAVLIDVGKFFYHSAIEWFPKLQLAVPQAVVLTHAHADASGGLDDLRDWTRTLRISMPVYARAEDKEALSKTAYYLLNPANSNSGGIVANLDFIFFNNEPFEPVEGLTLTPLTVEHGKGITCNGYRFGDVCYVSDVSSFPDETWDKMQGCQFLIIDSLRYRRTYGSHLTFEQAVEKTLALRPKRSLFVGMSHELEHYSTNAILGKLSKYGIDAQLAYDGLIVKANI